MMKIDGGCHCGNITYTAEIDPENVGICHCTDCQTLSGTAFRTSVRANKETFHLAGGQPKIYVKTAESGAKRAQAFCPSAALRFIRLRSATRRFSTSASARRASAGSCGRNPRGGADPRATGYMICSP